MKRLIFQVLLVAVGLSSGMAHAAKVTCSPSQVVDIYVGNTSTQVQLKDLGWHILGFAGDADLDKKLKKIRKARNKDYYIQLTFPDGYDATCLTTDATLAVSKVKIMKTKQSD